MSSIGTVIQNYFKISNASYTPYVIPHEFIYNLHIVASETLHVIQENRAWRILLRPPGIDAREIASSEFFSLPNPAKEVFT